MDSSDEANARKRLEGLLLDGCGEPVDLPLSLLKSITNNFSEDLHIGSGGFANVYKGLLRSGMVVAVKKLSNILEMHERKYNEEVCCLMTVKHKNVVRFLGYCADTQGKACDLEGNIVLADVRQRLLCFEYLSQGSLDKYITDASCGLEWRKRYRIIFGICEGLHYLHDKNIVHLDLKPGNILLDDNMVPKISDFGLSKRFGERQSRAVASKLYGTLGYLAPEFSNGEITFKLDIYSFGIIVTEILTGRRGHFKVEDVLESWRKRLETSSADTLLEHVRVCAVISLECINTNPTERPDLQCIIEKLAQLNAAEIETVQSEDVGGGKTEFAGAAVASSQPQLPAGSSSQHRRTMGSLLQLQVSVAKIPRVREELRQAAGEKLFAPQAMHIGPYHRSHGLCFSPWREEQKKKIVLDIQNNYDLPGLKRVVAELEPQVRQCYTHMLDPRMDTEEFSDMLLHDGCYLLSFFVDLTGGVDEQTTKVNETVVRDILYLLENQIPLFVLERMLDNLLRGLGGATSALHYIAGPVEQLLQHHLYISKSTTYPVTSESSTPSDLLHLVYSYFRRPEPADDPPAVTGRRWRWAEPAYGPVPGAVPLRSPTGLWRGATVYNRYANLRFRRRAFEPNDRWTILDIDLQGGILYIPFLRVHKTTWTLLRNLMALEEQEEERPVTAYCYFMSQVACTAEDVNLLQRANVLEHFMMGRDKQVAKGFADLCDEVAPLDLENLQQNYLKPLWHRLDKRCNDRVHNFISFFRVTYLRNGVFVLAFTVSAILFVTQMIMAVYSVLAYYSPPRLR